MRIDVAVLKLAFYILVIFTLFPVKAATTEFNKKFEFNIPSAKATKALEIIAKKTGHNLFYPAEKLIDISSNNLAGIYTLSEALAIILAGTKVEASITKKGVIIVHTRRKKVEKNKKELGFWASLFASKGDNSPFNIEYEQRRIKRQAKDEVERIAVTGYRESLSKALSYKKNADYQVDVMSAEDIGKLPDVEIGDVLERIAGVQVRRGNDGVVNGTSIRGLPGYFNRTLYNDRVISTSLSTERYFDSQIMPASFVSRVEVHKTSVADVVEGGLAGVINLKSLRAFDIGTKAVRLQITGTDTSNDDNKNSDIVAIFSDLYLDDTIGISAGVNLLKSETESQQGITFIPTRKLTEGEGKDYNGDGIYDNNDAFYVPQAVGYTLNKNSRQRNAAFANIEWRPTATFKIFGEIFYSGYDTFNIRDSLRFRTGTGNKSTGEGAQISSYEGALYTEGARDYLTIYHPTNTNAEVANEYNERESDILLTFFDAEWLYLRWSFNFSGNLTKSKTNQFTVVAKNLTARNYFDVTLDGTNLDNAWAVYFHDPVDDPGYSQRGLLNDAQAPFRALVVNGMHLGAEYESNSWAADFNGQYEFNQNNDYIFLTQLQFGLHFREDESLASNPNTNFVGNTEGLFNGSEIHYRTVEPARGQWFNLRGNQSGATLPWAVPDISAMVVSDKWTAESVRAAAINADIYKPGIRDDLKEDIFAAFIKVNFETYSAEITGNIGLRYVSTKQFASGQGSNIDEGLFDEGKGDPFAPDYEPVLTLPVEDNFTKKRSYHNLLPSLNLRYAIEDDVVMRLGWSKTMTRPLRQDLKVLDNYNQNRNTITSPDPDLAPFISTNIDLSLAWYYAKESAVTLALFYKDIGSLVQSHNYQRFLPVTHLETGLKLDDTNVFIEEKINGEGTKIKGATVTFQQPFYFLPSFLANTGITANYTYIDNSRPDLLTDVSKNNASLLFYYDAEFFAAQINYTYRGASISRQSTGIVPTRSFNASETINASLSYSPVEYLKLSIGIHNITEQSNSKYYANGMNDNYSDFGRIYSLTLTGRL